MANIIYRASVTPTVPTSTTAKGAPLTNLEVDGNFKSINTDVASRALSGANTDLTSIGGLTTALSLAQGGTGATSVATGPFAAKGINTDITSLGGITTPLSVSQGGTGKSTITGIVRGVGTGAMVTAVAADFPTLNQSTTGNAGSVTNGLYTNTDQTIGGTKFFSNRVIFSDGTAAVPSFSFASEGSQDTGIYWSADGVMNFSSNAQYAGKIAGGDLTMVNSVTAPNFLGVATAAASSSVSTFTTASTSFEGQLVARVSGQQDAYLYNNSSSWGLYSPSGGNVLTYNRSNNITTFVGNLVGYALRVGTTLLSTSTTAVTGRNYVATASLTLLLPAAPAIGDIVSFSNASGTTTCVIGRNNNNINSIAQDMTVNKLYAAFTLQYTDATRGWVFV